MAVQNQDKTFENFESNCFCFESVFSSDSTDPDKNFFKEQTSVNCFSVTISRKLHNYLRTIK